MNSYKCYKGYLSLKKIMDFPNIPFQTRLNIVKLKKSLESAAIAYEQSELDIANRYGDKNEDGSVCVNDGFVKITSPANLDASRIELAALQNEQVPFEEKRFSITPEMIGDLEITGTDIENLMPFIDFD